MQGTTDVAFTVVDVLGYLDEIPVCVGYEIDGEVTTEFLTTHLLEKANQYSRHFRDGNVTSEESRNTKIFRRTAETTSNLSRKRSDIRSQWFLMDREDMISSSEINRNGK